MKVAVTSQGSDLSSPVDPRFGRAAKFIVVDLDTDGFSVHDNAQNLNAAQGAGIQAGRTIVELGVDALLTGNVGPKAFTALAAGKVDVFTGASGTVEEALERLKAGKLHAAANANVEGHWT